LAKEGRIITDNGSFRILYHELDEGDAVVCRLSFKPAEEYLLVDLMARGVLLFPQARAQIASRSKVFQAVIFAPFMLPHTLVARDHHDLIEAIGLYAKEGIDQVVTKHDRKNAGMGIHLWSSLEEVYTQASYGVIPYPFVVQPFIPGCRDIRAIFLGNYEEAYERRNPYNFRNNLHFGGLGAVHQLTGEERDICKKVMTRGDFPFAHVDLLVTPDHRTYLSEINLRGGLKGAKIKGEEYQTRLKTIYDQQVASCHTKKGKKV